MDLFSTQRHQMMHIAFFKEWFLNTVLLEPYLVKCAADVFDKLFPYYDFGFMDDFLNRLFQKSIGSVNNEGIAHTLFFAIKYDIILDIKDAFPRVEIALKILEKPTEDQICESIVDLLSEDPISKLLLYKYLQKSSSARALDSLEIAIFKALETDAGKRLNDLATFQRQWIFIYEVLGEFDFQNSTLAKQAGSDYHYWSEMKKHGCSFYVEPSPGQKRAKEIINQLGTPEHGNL